jgi:hypothetical protein
MTSCPPKLQTLADLRELQRTIATALMSPLTRDDGLRASFKDSAQALIKPRAKLDSCDRLEIYARQYWFRLLDCLYDDYPGLRALLGDQRFHQLSRAYLAAHPSESWTLRNLGRNLESFIREHPKLTGAKHHIAIDIARFEWAQVIAFDEATHTPLCVDDLLGSDASALTLRLQPHLSLLELDHAVDDWFMAVRNTVQGSRSETSNARLESRALIKAKRVSLPKPQKLWLVVHRSGTDIYFKRLEREAWLLLKSLADGHPLLSAVGDALREAQPDRDWSEQVRDWFQSWASLGWFTR